MYTKYHTIYNPDGSIKEIESETYEFTLPLFNKVKKALSDVAFGISVLLDDECEVCEDEEE